MKPTYPSTRYFWTILGIIVFYGIMCLPILHAGFLGDDILNSLIHGYLQELHVGLLSFCLNTAVGWMTGAGRLYPLGFFMQYPFFYFFDTPTLYQAVRVVFIILSLLSSAWLIQLLFKNRRVSLFFLLVIPALWSIRGISDPLTSYSILLPGLTLFCMWSLCCFIKALEKKHAVFWQSISLLAYACAVMTYEIGIITIFCVFAIAYFFRSSKKSFFANILPHSILTLLYLVAYALVHHYGHGEYRGASLGHFDLNMLLTFLYQLTASLPLNYASFAGHDFKPVVFALYFATPFSIDLLIAVVLIAFFMFYRLFPTLVLTKSQRGLLFILGIILNIIPSLLIAITIKYQTILAWGLGYLPVYIQYLGTACIGIGLLSCLNTSIQGTHKANKIRVVLSVLFTLITALAFIFNTVTVKRENYLWQDGRTLDVGAIQHGLLNALPKQAVIISKDQWTRPAFYLQYGNRSNPSLILIKSKQIVPGSKPNAVQYFLTNYPFSGAKNAYIITGTVTQSHQGLSITSPQLVSQQKVARIFFMKHTQVPYAQNGSVLLGQITAMTFVSMNKKLELSTLTISKPVIFSKQGPHQQVEHLNQNIHMHVSWHCFRKFSIPPPSFNQIDHVNICQVP